MAKSPETFSENPADSFWVRRRIEILCTHSSRLEQA
jgi:hypothetical protein